MKWSQFNIEISLDDTLDKEKIVYNTFTDSRCIFTPKLDEIVLRACQGETLSDEDRKVVKKLSKLGILVPRDINEDRELEYWFQKIKFDSSILHLTILTTLDCNLRCSYCFESDVLQPVKLGLEKIEQMLPWINEQLQACNPRTVLLTFFGGEPLLNWEAIELLSREISALTHSRGTDVEFQLITNGVLLDEKHVNFLTSYGQTQIKVTLDGDEPAHNSKRPLSDGRGTFQTIISNLLPLLGKVDLIIGGNYDEKNLASISNLLDYLISNGFNEANCSLAFKPIMAIPDKEAICKPCTYSETKVEDILWTITETEKRGLKAWKKIALQPCEALREWSFTIDPFGQLYKCPAMVGRPEGVIGDLSSKMLNYTNTLFMTADHWKKCGQCSFRPICNGGCGFSAAIKHGDYKEIACEKKYMQGVSLELIKEECLEAFSLLGAP